MAQPVAPHRRIPTLDVARGIAILAIVFVNVIALGGPQLSMLDPYAWGEPSRLDLWVHHGVRVFVAGKFISIFALLFGMGLALQCRRLDARGAAPRVYLKRQGLLMAMGLLHGTLLWWGDILFVYSIIGACVFLLRNTKTSDLKPFAVAMIAVGTMMTASAALSFAAIPTDLAEVMGPLREQVELPASTPAWLATIFAEDDVLSILSMWEVRAFGSGPLLLSLSTRSVLFFGQAFAGLPTVGLWVGGLMLLGVVFANEDFVQDDARQRWWLKWGVGVGLSVELFANGVGAVGQFPITNAAGASLEALSALVKPLFGIGIFAGICQICRHTDLLRVFAPAGRLALTLYIGQSVVLNLLFVHWGLAWFGTMGRAATSSVCVVLIVAQLAFAHLWLRLFSRGPLEAVWRRLTYGRPSRDPAEPAALGSR